MNIFSKGFHALVATLVFVFLPLSATFAQLFTDVTASSTSMPMHSLVATADFDRDGVEDLLVNTYNSSTDTWSAKLWKRQGSFNYSDVTSGSGLQGLEAASAADFNNDGFCDFIHINGNRTEAAFYRNNGNTTFTKVSLPATESTALLGFQDTVRAVDIDRDGDLDLVFGKALGSGGSIVALLNQSRNGGSASQPFSGVSTLAVTSWIHNKADVTDANGDGKADLLSIRTAGNWSSGTHPDFPVTLFLNTGNASADYLNANATRTLAGFSQRDNCGISAANVMSPIASWDIDNDGDLDLINGSSDWPWTSRPHIYINDGVGNYTQMNSPVYQSTNYYHHGISIFDADLDNDMDAVWTSLHNFADIYPRMWRNDGNLTFTDVTTAWGVTARYAGSANMGSAGHHADLDGDGDVDFVIQMWSMPGGPIYRIYRNEAVQQESKWLGVKLVPSVSAPNGIGARVEVTANGKKLTQYMGDITGGVRNLSHLTFGLGKIGQADSVKVYWPSGNVSELTNVSANRVLEVNEIATIDSDGDGVNDYRELYDGTDPYDSTSFDPLSVGLFAHYPLDGNIKDESGFDRHGAVLSGGFGIDRLGQQDGAFALIEDANYATIPLDSSQFNGNLTIVAYAKFEDFHKDYPHILFGHNAFLVFHGLGPAYNYVDRVQEVSYLEYTRWTGGNDWERRSEVYSSKKLNPKQWYQIVVTRTPDSANIFIDGVLYGTASSKAVNLLSGNFIQVGRGFLGDPSQSMRGSIDDLKFYNRALSAAEVSQLYSEESGEPNMVLVQGGTLPSSSQLAGQKVGTFQIGKYEVTWGEWKKVRDWAVKNGYSDLAGVGAGSGDDHPVRNVSWYDVVKWCNAKSEMEGLMQVYQVNGSAFKTGEGLVSFNLSGEGYRLPRESEWEWAARGGNSSKGYVYSGSDNLYSVGWFKLNAKGSILDLGKIVLDKYRDDFEKLSLENKNKLLGTGTWPVGKKNANELGIFDMSGNVWEWCWEQQVNNDTDITRRKRGGSWYDYDATANLVSRWANFASRENEFSNPLQHNLESQGFRLARNSGTPDTTAPVIAITSISANARLTSANATFVGTITETGSKPTLQYRLGTTGNWTASTVGGSASPYSFSQLVALKPGPNTVQFQAKDDAGNTSAISSLNVSYVVASTLTIPAPNAADGSVTSGFGGSTSREVGVSYTVTATPASGMLFKEWLKNGTRLSTNATLSFTMEPGLKLTPVFVPDYAKLGGVYNGLVGTGAIGTGSAADMQAFAAGNGFLQFTLGSNGALSGFLRIEGKSHPFSGTMGSNKKAGITVQRPGKGQATLGLNLVSKLPGEISGNVTLGGGPLAFRALRGGTMAAGTNHALAGKRYSIVFPAPAGVAMGYGYATLGVENNGSAVLAGVLASGQAVNAGARLVDDGAGNWMFPVFVGGSGIFTGEIVIPKTPPASGSEIGGSIEWLKPASNRGLFRGGFLKRIEPLGASHNATSSGLGGAAFRLTLDPAKRLLPAAVTQNGTWANGATTPSLSAPLASNLALRFNPLFGSFEGSFNRTASGAAARVPFQGTLLSRPITIPGGPTLRGAGFFTSGNASSAVEITSNATVTPSANMITVQGGTLPSSSQLAGQTVATFQIGKYEMTWGEWKEVRDWAVANGYTDLANVGAGSGDNHPVRNVNWYDVVKWCNAKSEMEGLTPVYQVGGAILKTGQSVPIVNSVANGYRLPLEKEWEWAALGGVSSQGYTYSGSNYVNVVAWTSENSSGAAVNLNSGSGTWPIGQKGANELGLHDMSGNVWEWCWDVYDGSGPLASSLRRFRGGGWSGSKNYSEVFVRDAHFADNRSVYPGGLGFRLARNAGN